MSEEQNITGNTSEAKSQNSNDGNKSETMSIVERADSAVKRLEDTEKRVSQKIQQLEELEARRIIGGKSNAGQVMKTPEMLREEKVKAQADDIVKRFHR